MGRISKEAGQGHAWSNQSSLLLSLCCCRHLERPPLKSRLEKDWSPKGPEETFVGACIRQRRITSVLITQTGKPSHQLYRVEYLWDQRLAIKECIPVSAQPSLKTKFPNLKLFQSSCVPPEKAKKIHKSEKTFSIVEILLSKKYRITEKQENVPQNEEKKIINWNWFRNDQMSQAKQLIDQWFSTYEPWPLRPSTDRVTGIA